MWKDVLLLMSVSVDVSLPLSVESCRAQEEEGEEASIHGFIHTSIHMSSKSLLLQTSEADGLHTSILTVHLCPSGGAPLGFGGGLRTRSTSSAETMAGSYLRHRSLMRWFTVPTHDCH